MRTLGIDHGDVRVGLALSDEEGILAMPLETIEAANALKRICEIVMEKEVQRIVVGLPKNMDGTEGPKAAQVRQFIQWLAERTKIEIKAWDERLTTRLMEREMIAANVSRKNRKKIVDQLAAQQILQGFLDANGPFPSDPSQES